jgi:hypothetical protein
MVSAHPAYATDRPTSDPLCGPDSSGGPEAFSPVITCSVGGGSSLGLPLVPGRSSGAGRATFKALSFIGGATLCSSIEDHHCCHHHAPPPAQVVSEGIATIPPAATACAPAHPGGPPARGGPALSPLSAYRHRSRDKLQFRIPHSLIRRDEAQAECSSMQASFHESNESAIVN